jgi:hypothetical protein
MNNTNTTHDDNGSDYTARDGKTYTGGLADEMRRSDRAAEWLQTIPTEILAAAARGDLDLNTIARAELGNRGLNRAGKWVGFPEARRLAEQAPTFNANGERVFVTIPND